MKKLCSSIIIVCLFFIIACDDTGGGGSSGGVSSVDAEIVSVVPSSSTIYAGHVCELSYTVDSDDTADDVVISLYLMNKDEYDASGDASTVEEGALLHVDTINVSAGESTSRVLTAKTPDTLSDGNYYISAFINEYNSDTGSQPDYITTDAVALSTANINNTNLRITNLELEDTTIILDSLVDSLNYLNANLASLQSQFLSFLDNPSDPAELAQLVTELATGLVSDAEIKGHVEIACDGPLPAVAPQIKAQVNIDGVWTDLEFWDNLQQSFENSISVSFEEDPEDSDMDYNENGYSATIDIDINISDTVIANILTQLSANITDIGSMLENPNLFHVRLVIDCDGDITEVSEDDNIYEFSMSTYMLPYTKSLSGSLELDEDLTPITSKSISNGSSGNDYIYEREWSKSVGEKSKFKAGVDYFSRYAVYNNSTKKGVYAKTELEVPIYILSNEFKLLDAYCRISSYISRPVYTGYQYSLSFFLNTLVSKECWGSHLPLVERGYTWSKEKRIGRYKFTVGPIPFKVDVGVNGSAGYSLEFGVLEDGLFLENTMPNLEFGIIADGGPTIGVASSGVTANLILIEETVDSRAELTFAVDPSDPDNMLTADFGVSVQNDLKAISGKFGMYVEYKKFKNWGWRNAKARLWIYKTDPLYESNKALCRYNESLTFPLP